MGVGDLGEIVDDARRIALGRPEKAGDPHSLSPSADASPAVSRPALVAPNRMNRRREFLPSTLRIPIDTVGAQGTAGRIQSSADLESIEPKATPGFSPSLCPLGNSGKKATGCETAGYRTTGIPRRAGRECGP